MSEASAVLAGLEAASNTGAAAAIDFAALNGKRGLESIAAEWRALIEQNPESRYFQYPEWHHANLTSLESKPEQVWFITARRQGKLLGVFPLRREERRVRGVGVRRLCTITHPHATLADFAFPRTDDGIEVFRQFNEWIQRQRAISWDELALEGVPEKSSIAFAIAAAAPAPLVKEVQGRSAYLSTSGSLQQTLSPVSGSFKRNLRRLARRAEQTAPLHYRIVREPADLAMALEKFLDIEASGWKGSDGTGSAIRLDPARQAFYESLCRGFSRAEACRINLLEQGDQAIAAQFCLVSGGTLNVLKIGFLGTHAALAPGNLVMEATIQDCCSDGAIQTMSFVTNPPWAHLWKPEQEPVWRYRTYRRNVRGLLLYALLRIKHRFDAQSQPEEISSHQPSTASEEPSDAGTAARS